MSVSKKLTIGFLVVLILAAAVSIVGIIGMRNLREAGSYMYEMRVTSLSHVNSAKSAFDMMRIEVGSLVTNSFFDDKKSSLDNSGNFEAYALEFLHWMEESRAISDTRELLEFHDRILAEFNEFYLPCARRIISTGIDDIPEHKNRFLINAEMAYLTTITEKIDSYITGLTDLNTALARQTDIDNAWQTQIYVLLQLALLLVACACAVIVARLVVKSIAMPIREAAEVLGAVAEGDFSKQIGGNYQGEFAVIKHAVNTTAEQLSVYIEKTMRAQEIAHKSNLEKARVEAASEAMVAGMNYASSIQRNILPPESAFEEAFTDYSVIWKPRDIVGGDIYWLANFDKGSLLCVCDCTGHGTPGALLTMLVTSIFNATINEENCSDTAQVIYTLDQRLAEALNANTSGEEKKVKDGCDIAALFVARDGKVTLSSAHTRVFICDGREVTQVRGQNIYVGEGSLKGKEEVEVVTLPANPDNKFYIASDGLYDQTGGERGLPFGYKNFMKLILAHHNETQTAASRKIWNHFEEYRGEMERLDDFELITFNVRPPRRGVVYRTLRDNEILL